MASFNPLEQKAKSAFARLKELEKAQPNIQLYVTVSPEDKFLGKKNWYRRKLIPTHVWMYDDGTEVMYREARLKGFDRDGVHGFLLVDSEDHDTLLVEYRLLLNHRHKVTALKS
jgi:hypothetical protein